jgi:hypothetical protein
MGSPFNQLGASPGYHSTPRFERQCLSHIRRRLGPPWQHQLKCRPLCALHLSRFEPIAIGKVNAIWRPCIRVWLQPFSADCFGRMTVAAAGYRDRITAVGECWCLEGESHVRGASYVMPSGNEFLTTVKTTESTRVPPPTGADPVHGQAPVSEDGSADGFARFSRWSS